MTEFSPTNLQRLHTVASRTRQLTVALMIIHFLATHLPHVSHSALAVGDKTLHLAAYLTLTLFVLASWELSTGILRPQHYFAVWVAGTLCGLMDEVTQIPVGRSCNGLDWLADIVGILLGLTIFRVARPLMYRVFCLSQVDCLAVAMATESHQRSKHGPSE